MDGINEPSVTAWLADLVPALGEKRDADLDEIKHGISWRARAVVKKLQPIG